jgi:hypothetical protein
MRSVETAYRLVARRRPESFPSQQAHGAPPPLPAGVPHPAGDHPDHPGAAPAQLSLTSSGKLQRLPIQLKGAIPRLNPAGC